MRRRARELGTQLDHGVPASGKWTARRASRREGRSRRWRRGGEGLRETALEFLEDGPYDAAHPSGGEARAAERFVDRDDAADFEESVEGSSAPSGIISNCGWIILRPRPEREGSTLP